MDELKITSPAFEHNQKIPSKYTCDGEDINPELIIENIPKGTATLALIIDDPDAPVGNWDHWIVFNIEPKNIDEDSIPGIQGINSWGRNSYGGPCPPSGTHRYFFKVYALDAKLPLPENTNKKQLESEIQDHILAKGELIGLYQRGP